MLRTLCGTGLPGVLGKALGSCPPPSVLVGKSNTLSMNGRKLVIVAPPPYYLPVKGKISCCSILSPFTKYPCRGGSSFPPLANGLSLKKPLG